MEPPVRLSETELKFAYGNSPSSVTLRVSNEWNAGLLFKVKTTNPDRYAVRPKMGFLPPDGSFDIVVCKTLEEHNTVDRFLIVFVPHSEPKKDAVISDLWKALEGNEILAKSMQQRRFTCRGRDLQSYRDERECVFVTPPNELLMCPICQDPFDDPAITPCGHTFCRNCILSTVLHQKNACPLCRTYIPRNDRGEVTAPPNLLIKAQVGELKVHCKFGVRKVGGKWEQDPKGCSEILTLENRKSHYDNCAFKNAASNAVDEAADQLKSLSVNGQK